MNSNDAVINPVRGRKSPDPGPVVILVSGKKDFQALCGLFKGKPSRSMDFLMSRICTFSDEEHHFSVVGPIIGAPYAAILLENLIAWGAQKVVFFGLCGSISPEIKIGDILLPAGSFIEEGTSLHYGGKTGDLSLGSQEMFRQLKTAFSQAPLDVREGVVWTTDAVFRETRELVCAYQEKNALGVEMELSALFTIGNYRGIDVGAVLVVSDELSTFQWKPGFGTARFKKQCKSVQRMISKLCLTLRPKT